MVVVASTVRVTREAPRDFVTAWRGPPRLTCGKTCDLKSRNRTYGQPLIPCASPTSPAITFRRAVCCSPATTARARS